jgi:hypothetical protein
MTARDALHARLYKGPNENRDDLIDAYRAEVLTEAAAKLDRIADTVEARVTDHYGAASGIGPGSADMLREAGRAVLDMAGKDTGGTPAGEPTQPAPDTDASTAFMQLGTTPALAGLRAELHVEGHPPLIGRYAGFGSRSVGDGEALLIEPALLFHWAAEGSTKPPVDEPALSADLAAYVAAGTCTCRVTGGAHRADLHDEHGMVRDIVPETAAGWDALVHARCARCGWTSRQTWLRAEFTQRPAQSYIAKHRDQLTGACVAPKGESEIPEPHLAVDDPGMTPGELLRTPKSTAYCATPGCGHGDNIHGPFCFAAGCDCTDWRWTEGEVPRG